MPNKLLSLLAPSTFRSTILFDLLIPILHFFPVSSAVCQCQTRGQRQSECSPALDVTKSLWGLAFPI